MHANEATFVQPIVASVFAMSSGRLGAFTAAVAGLIGLVIGGLALARSTGRTRSARDAGAVDGLNRAIVAVALGMIGVVLGALIAVTSDGSVGTGNGLGGAVVAMALGLTAVVLGGLARVRERAVT
jgi:hypothetical protein